MHMHTKAQTLKHDPNLVRRCWFDFYNSSFDVMYIKFLQVMGSVVTAHSCTADVLLMINGLNNVCTGFVLEKS